MTNKALERGQVLPLKTPSTVKSGDLVIFGALYGAPVESGEQLFLAGIATEDATDAFSNVKPFIGVDREGAFNLAVQGEGGCPLVLHALKPGDPVFADINGPGATYTAATNCWTGAVLNSNQGGVHIGWVLDAVAAGAGLTTVRVVFK